MSYAETTGQLSLIPDIYKKLSLENISETMNQRIKVITSLRMRTPFFEPWHATNS